ncbi:MAG: biotin--[acetyl-CoA-carboxylase] ligase [Deltaproteobacteria bacterium]|nr:biotin--[acetyl-CoA-carboxylase] ligase [Deltaproteobacteria bacterium]
MEPAVDIGAIKPMLQTRLLGKNIQYWAEVDSTNAALSRLVASGSEEGTVVIADAQRAGRGRLGKSWISPPGVNLHLSVLLRPQLKATDARFLTLIGSLAIADVLDTYGVKSQVKWPNDVLVADKKIAGVLTEVQLRNGHTDHFIIGLGVNLNIDRPMMARAFGEAAAGATSLYEALEQKVDRNLFAAQLLERLEHHYFAFLEKGATIVREQWCSRSFLGRRVSVKEEDMHVEGIALDLDDEGCLVVALDDGSTVHVREGEVVPLH